VPSWGGIVRSMLPKLQNSPGGLTAIGLFFVFRGCWYLTLACRSVVLERCKLTRNTSYGIASGFALPVSLAV
jgi:hypothetical protein